MDLGTVRIVLVATSHPGNIGAAARAMKTMGLSRLYLVAPKSYPHQKALEMAAGADDILRESSVVTSLDEALEGCELVLATSARPRGLDLPGLTPRSCVRLLSQKVKGSEVAIVFGREHAGLTNEELLRCNYHILIPSNPEYSSLNLAQAVQVIAYELRLKMSTLEVKANEVQAQLTTAEEMERFYTHLTEVMVAVDFLKPTKPTRRLLQRIRRLFNRTGLEKEELSILRGILTHVQKAVDESKKI